MDQYLLKAQHGFIQGVLDINACVVSPIVASELIDQAINNLSNNSNNEAFDVEYFFQKYQKENFFSITRKQILNAVTSMQYIHSHINTLDVESLSSSLSLHTNLNATSISLILKSFEKYQSSGKEKIKVALDKLVGFEWKLGVSLQSSSSKDLSSPFIAILLHIQSGNKFSSHAIELSIPEFHTFQKQFNSIKSVIDMV